MEDHHQGRGGIQRKMTGVCKRSLGICCLETRQSHLEYDSRFGHCHFLACECVRQRSANNEAGFECIIAPRRVCPLTWGLILCDLPQRQATPPRALKWWLGGINSGRPAREIKATEFTIWLIGRASVRRWQRTLSASCRCSGKRRIWL